MVEGDAPAGCQTRASRSGSLVCLGRELNVADQDFKPIRLLGWAQKRVSVAESKQSYIDLTAEARGGGV